MPSLDNNLYIQKYKGVVLDMLRLSFPQLTLPEIEYGVDLAIREQIQDHDIVIDNNYKKTKVNTTLLELSHFILSKEPIITAYGVMFSKHGSVDNPIYKMVNGFIIGRDKAKKQMFQYPKGTHEFQSMNLLQLLMKL